MGPARRPEQCSGRPVRLYAQRESVSVSANGVIRVEWNANGDDFTNNLIRARCEGRFSFAVPRPGGVVRLELTGAYQDSSPSRVVSQGSHEGDAVGKVSRPTRLRLGGVAARRVPRSLTRAGHRCVCPWGQRCPQRGNARLTTRGERCWCLLVKPGSVETTPIGAAG